jgi:hypothetical protein
MNHHLEFLYRLRFYQISYRAKFPGALNILWLRSSPVCRISEAPPKVQSRTFPASEYGVAPGRGAGKRQRQARASVALHAAIKQMGRPVLPTAELKAKRSFASWSTWKAAAPLQTLARRL